jgi:hypothetical protein
MMEITFTGGRKVGGEFGGLAVAADQPVASGGGAGGARLTLAAERGPGAEPGDKAPDMAMRVPS